MKWHQRYKCKNCGYQYTKTTPRGKPEEDKILALILFSSGLLMRATAKIVGVTTQSVMRWIRQMHNKFITEKPDISMVTEVEMDENRKYYVRKTIDHRSKKLIGWALGRRDTKTLIKMYNSNVYSKRYESYKEIFPQNNLTQSKKYTMQIERNNGRQRHCLAAFRQHSIVVTRSLENLAISIALFARFRINGSIDELITLLKRPPLKKRSR